MCQCCKLVPARGNMTCIVKPFAEAMPLIGSLELEQDTLSQYIERLEAVRGDPGFALG